MDFRAALIEETQAFGDVMRGAPASWDDVSVPTCPGWSLTQLLKHVGRGNRWCAQIIDERRNEPLDPREVRDGKPPEDHDGAIEWLNAGAQKVIDAVDHAADLSLRRDALAQHVLGIDRDAVLAVRRRGAERCR